MIKRWLALALLALAALTGHAQTQGNWYTTLFPLAARTATAIRRGRGRLTFKPRTRSR